MCNKIFESDIKLKTHFKLDHVKNSFSQTDEVISDDKVFKDKQIQVVDSDLDKNKYPRTCFYCDNKILSEDHLKNHSIQCGISANPFLVKKPPAQIEKEVDQVPCPSVSMPQNNPNFSSFPVRLPPHKCNQGTNCPQETLPRTSLKCENCGWMVSCNRDLFKHKQICMEIKSNFYRYPY